MKVTEAYEMRDDAAADALAERIGELQGVALTKVSSGSVFAIALDTMWDPRTNQEVDVSALDADEIGGRGQRGELEFAPHWTLALVMGLNPRETH